MTIVGTTIHLPSPLWRAIQALTPQEGDTNTVILRALEDYVTATRKYCCRPRPGKYQKLLKALSTPVTDLHLSARPSTALHVMNIRYVYELVALEPRDLRTRKNFGKKSLGEVTDKLAALELTLGMTLDDDTYRAAVVAAVAASIQAATQ